MYACIWAECVDAHVCVLNYQEYEGAIAVCVAVCIVVRPRLFVCVQEYQCACRPMCMCVGMCMCEHVSSE